jgi:hypothetical protein
MASCRYVSGALPKIRLLMKRKRKEEKERAEEKKGKHSRHSFLSEQMYEEEENTYVLPSRNFWSIIQAIMV